MLELKSIDIKKYLINDVYEFLEDVTFLGNVAFDKSAYFSANAYFRGNAYFRANAYFRTNADFRGNRLIVMETMYWSHASIPKLPADYYVKFLMPPAWQKEHYQERLGFALKGCYEEIKKELGKKVFTLLNDEKWLPVERIMLECIRDSEKDCPSWVSEIINSENKNEIN